MYDWSSLKGVCVMYDGGQIRHVKGFQENPSPISPVELTIARTQTILFQFSHIYRCTKNPIVRECGDETQIMKRRVFVLGK
jgi:hypothetical protein